MCQVLAQCVFCAPVRVGAQYCILCGMCKVLVQCDFGAPMRVGAQSCILCWMCGALAQCDSCAAVRVGALISFSTRIPTRRFQDCAFQGAGTPPTRTPYFYKVLTTFAPPTHSSILYESKIFVMLSTHLSTKPFKIKGCRWGGGTCTPLSKTKQIQRPKHQNVRKMIPVSHETS